MNAVVKENAKRRMNVRMRIQTHPDILKMRGRLAEAARHLPASDSTQAETLEKLTRRFVGGKMPKNVVQTYSCFTVRVCISGIVFSAAVFNSLGGRENHKLCEPMSRLADAISYHFRNSRMRGLLSFNFCESQAKADSEILREHLEALGQILVSCRVPVMNEIAVESGSADQHDHALSRIVVLEAQVKQLAQLTERIAALETILRCSSIQTPPPPPDSGDSGGTAAYPLTGIPSSF